MTAEGVSSWKDQLSEDQRGELQWLLEHRCTLEAEWAERDPLHDLPPGWVMQALVDKHIVVKVRGTSIPELFEQVSKGARVLYNFVERKSL